MHRKLWFFILAFAFLYAFNTGASFAGSPSGSVVTTTGQTLTVEITSPADNSIVVVPPGEHTIEGLVNLGASTTPSKEINVIYVIDVSGSTNWDQNNDVNQDGKVDSADDVNNDGRNGTILDAEIAGVIALNKSIGASANVKVGLVVFGNSAVLSDVSPAPGRQDFTTPLADIDGNGVIDLEESVTSIKEAHSGQNNPQRVGSGTNFASALKMMNSGFQNISGSGNAITFFLSDGFDNNGFKASTSSIITTSIGLGVKINTFAVGKGADSSNTGSLAGIANETGGAFTVVTDPASLSTALPTVPVVGISKVEVNGTTVTLSAVGTFRHNVTGLVSGANNVVVNATADDGSVATANVDLQGAAQIVADFSADPVKGMEPLTVKFTNLSGGDATDYAWDFGDGNTSTDKDPQHEYIGPGMFSVSLTATGSGGSDTKAAADLIDVLPRPTVVADFDADITEGEAPLAVNFTDTTVSTETISSWAWDFGDSGTSTVQNPSHTYDVPGKYAVTLTIESGGVVDSMTKVEFINATKPVVPLVADFDADPLSGIAPLDVAFFDQSTGDITTWEWDFGDNSGTNTTQSPAHTYSSAGAYTVKLTITGPSGTASEEKIALINVLESSAPVADFSADPTAGFATLKVQFTDLSAGNPTSWAWEFGDGNTSSLQNPSNDYKTAGIFTVGLTASSGSSSQEIKTNLITVLPTPPVVAEFKADPTSGFAPLSVAFTDMSAGDATSWAWEFGDGNISSDQNPTNEYKTAGFFTVTLTTSGSSGSDKEIKTNLINVLGKSGPVADFKADPTAGLAPLEVQFTDLTTGNPTSWSWEFGDGAVSSDQNPQHTYNIENIYTVKLTASNSEGSDTETKQNLISVGDLPKPTAEFKASTTSGAAPLLVKFTDLSTGEPTSWSWDFGDGGVSSDQNPEHTYMIDGIYGVKLTASNAGGSDTENKPNLIFVLPGGATTGPTADFKASPLTGFAPLDVQFTDLSQPAGDIASWSWDFGDGSTGVIQNPKHTYLVSGFHSVSLLVSNAGGIDTENKPNLINVIAGTKPIAQFSASPTSGLAPLNVEFKDLSQPVGSVDSWTWTFGDGGTSSDQNPTHEYNTEGIFSVSLTASNSDGIDVETKTNMIFVKGAGRPVAEFAASPTSGNAPLEVQFTDRSSGDIDGWFWTFGDGSTSSEQSPVHEYINAGVFTVTLGVSGAGGTDSITKTNLIKAAGADKIEAQFTAAPTRGKSPLTVQFEDNSAGTVDSWLWDFGDNNTSDQQNPEHIYDAEGEYTVALTVSNSSESDTETKSDFIQVVPDLTGNFVVFFDYSPRIGEAPLEVQFFDQTFVVGGGKPESWNWDFGDGDTSDEESPKHTYKLKNGEKVSDYDVSLTVTVDGQSDTLVVKNAVKVFEKGGEPTPEPTTGPTPVPGNCEATMQIKPATINSNRSRGKVKALIELSEGCVSTFRDIDCASIRLEGVKPISCKIKRKKFKAKFNVQALGLTPGVNQQVTLTGSTFGGDVFSAVDFVDVK